VVTLLIVSKKSIWLFTYTELLLSISQCCQRWMHKRQLVLCYICSQTCQNSHWWWWCLIRRREPRQHDEPYLATTRG